MNESMITGIVCVLCGLFSIICALKDFDWFMNNRRAAFFVRIFGRGGARVFYILLGIAIVIFGVYGASSEPSLLRRSWFRRSLFR
jgi:uncharacterized membrane protein YuzA (DUF378 family)